MIKFKLKQGLIYSLLLGVSVINFSASIPDEGMFPLSELSRAGLKKAGLKIAEKDIYNAEGHVALVDALVQVGGCTGSFVSPNGLIITNHHCAFSAVQLASSPEFNYLKNGFVANGLEQEIQAQGLTIRITESYEDVSNEVLKTVQNVLDPKERINTINKKRSEIAKRAEMEDPSITAEVSEMFIGKSYVLFRYKRIEDVRLVYVPRQDIGEFGGESDNWVWPRHTGDFSFLRAYVAPDGKSAKYHKENVPYHPKKHLKINASGVSENDFAFILGYPGRTFRHRPAQYMEYQERYLLPYTSNLYEFQNEQMALAAKNDLSMELALATRVKRNANVLKNYRGKLKGLGNLGLVEQKYEEDKALTKFIENNSEYKKRYGSLMNDIDNYYQQVENTALKELWFNNLYNSSSLLRISSTINSFKDAVLKQNGAKAQDEFFKINLEQVKDYLDGIYGSFNLQVDKNIGVRMFEDAYEFTGENKLAYFDANAFNGKQDAAQQFVTALDRSNLTNKKDVFNNILKDVQSLKNYSDELLTIQRKLDQEVVNFEDEQKRREGVLNRLMGDYVAIKEKYQSKSFIPDANSTLRLTFGNIKGYSPADATYMSPFTTVKGLIEKGNSGLPEYAYPETIKTAWLSKNFGAYVKKELNDVPVNILYNMDTTGGNSGSPIMNAYGELIGVNFDRAYDATINDFAWNEEYSRSIGVDIRYVLWVADKIDNAQFIIQEMGI